MIYLLSLLHAVAVATAAAVAAPQIVFPFNSQVPPVARVGEAFNFTFSDHTFRPNDAKVLYSISDGPAWLQFDAPGRTLWGMPGASDIRPTKFHIIASNEGGSVSMKCTLVISTDPAPTSDQDVSAVLGRAGNKTGLSSLLTHPLQQFTLDFSSRDYVNHGKRLFFYSTLSNHTPLPAWLKFDDQNLHYIGTPPQLSSSPQSFDVILIASDVRGFAAVSDHFTIVVSSKRWIFRPSEYTIDLAAGNAVKVDNLYSKLFLNDQIASQSDVQQATAEVPPWLTFDPRELLLHGQPPLNVKTQDIRITAYDHFGDCASITLHLRLGSLLKNAISPPKAYIGEQFEYTFNRSDLSEPNVLISIDTSSAGPWLQFDKSLLRLSGTVPRSQSTGMINLTMSLTAPNRSEVETENIELDVRPTSADLGADPTSTMSADGTAVDSPFGTATQPVMGSIGYRSRRTKGTLVAVIVCPLVGLAVIVLILLYCQRSRGHGGKGIKSPSKSEISRPIPGSGGDQLIADLEKGHVLDGPPKLAVVLPRTETAQVIEGTGSSSPRRLTQRLSRIRRSVGSSNNVLEDGEAEALDGFNRSSWGYWPPKAPSNRPHDSTKIPTIMARGSKHLVSRQSDYRSSATSQHRRRISQKYQRLPGRGHGRHSIMCSSMGSADCPTGAGHGRVSTYSCPYCAAPHGASTMPMRTHEEIIQHQSVVGTEAPGIVSAMRSPWPIPLTWQSMSTCRIPKMSRLAATLSSAKAARSGSTSEISNMLSDLPDRRSLFEKRHSYIRNRVQTRSPFFGSSSNEPLSRKVSSAESKHPAWLGLKMASQPSLKKLVNQRQSRLERSASSSLDPDMRRGRKRHRSKWKLAEGFPRALSRAHGSVKDSVHAEDTSEDEWEWRSTSVYSDVVDADADAGAQIDADSLSDASSRPKALATKNVSVPDHPTTEPPVGPLPTPPFPFELPSKSPRRSLAKPRSAFEPLASDTLTTMQKPDLTGAILTKRSSRLPRIDKLVTEHRNSKGKKYPDLKRSSIMERPRASYRPASLAKRVSSNRTTGAHAVSNDQASKIDGLNEEKSWEDMSCDEAFL